MERKKAKRDGRAAPRAAPQAAPLTAALTKQRLPALETAASFFVLALVYATLVSRFDLRLLASDSILTGGDSASWYQVLETLAKDFLPRGRIFGFSQANFFGYLEGQHYFVLPFLAAALLGSILPLTAALKVATVAGGFLLPASLFAAGWSIAKKPRAGALASAGGLLFLFNESYTMFGGNWLSTFAGEFCYSWAIALLPLLAASAIRDWDDERSGIGTGIILALIGLCHFFVFMPAFFLPFFPVFRLLGRKARPEGKKIVARIMRTYAAAFSLMAFWLVPMATTRQWAQPISMIWRFDSPRAFLRQTLAWIWIPAGLIFVVFAARHGRLKARTSAFFLYALGACAFLFACAPGLGMPDIRFVPSALLLCILGLSHLASEAASTLGRGRGRGRAAGKKAPSEILLAAFIVLAGLGACFATLLIARNSPGWFAWNYSGYEAKPQWAFLESLGKDMPRGMEEGRLLWEKQDQRDNGDFGSERGFENLWLFAGRPSSEGIHYGSSHMARASTYLQSRYSPNPADPEPERIYAQLDEASWAPSFELVNAWGIIAHSADIKARLDRHPDFILDRSLGKFSIYAFRGYKASYVSVIPDGALNVVREGGGGFRGDYYRFFREYELYGYPFVSSAFADAELLALPGVRSYTGYREYRNLALAKAALGAEAGGTAPEKSVITEESLDNFRIAFRTSRPGKPHYIRVAYAPGWRSKGGERIYPASPGFMVLVPKGEEVVLEYGRSAWEILGLCISLAALPLCILLFRYKPGKRFPWRALAGFAFVIFAGGASILVIKATSGYPALSRDMDRARRLNLRDAVQRKEALEILGRWTDEESLERFDNMLVFDAYLIEARALALEGRKIESEEDLRLLREHYPHTRALSSARIGP